MKETMSRRAGSAFGRKKYIPLFLILLVGTVLRFYHNLDISLWHDEAFSALLIKYPWSEMMYRIGLDVHPPMYYIFLRLWHYIFGNSLLALRGFTVLFSVGIIWAAWLFVKAAFKNDKAALIAAGIVAFNTFQIEYASEARMYTMGAFFALLGAYFLVRALEEQRNYYIDQKLNMPNLPEDIKLKRNFVWHYLGFAASMAIICLTHYYLLFTAAALCLYALIYHIAHYRLQFKKYLIILASYFIILLSFLPWLKTFLFQVKQVGAGYWIPPMDVWSIPSTIWTIVLGFAFDVNNLAGHKWVILTTVVIGIILIDFVRRTNAMHKWLIIMTVLAPFLGAVAFYLKGCRINTELSFSPLQQIECKGSSVYLVRYFLYMSGFLSIAIGTWLAKIKYRWLGISLAVVLIGLNMQAFYQHWKDINIKTRPGMNAAAAFLGANVNKNDHVFLGTSFEFFNYKYYKQTYYPLPLGLEPLLYTGGEKYAKNIPHFAGSAILTDQDLAPSFGQFVNKGDTAWLLWTYAFGANPPEVPNSWCLKNYCGKEITRQVLENGSQSFPDVRPYLGTNIYISEFKVN